MKMEHLRRFGIKSIKVVHNSDCGQDFRINKTLSRRPNFYVFLSKHDMTICKVYIPNISIEDAWRIENEYLFGHQKYE